MLGNALSQPNKKMSTPSSDIRSAPSILAIESSCDETAAAVYTGQKIRSNIIASQEIHARYGGVVPELASRNHMQNIVTVVDEALRTAGMELHEMDAIAVTRSPGLMGPLLVGCGFAKSLSLATGKPLIGVHHMQAHVLANLLSDEKPSFPFLCLTVSGGHTQIVLCESPYLLTVLGETLDDAAGEAFDKSAKLLGLPYPGGPLIDRYAAEGDPLRYNFPGAHVPGLDFSFSGLKTSILYFVRNAGSSMVYKETFTATQEEQQAFVSANIHDICASVQHRIIHMLMDKLRAAVKQTGVKTVCIAGGVSANKGLRRLFLEEGNKFGWKTYVPDFAYCTDNAAMIAITGYYKFLDQDFSGMDLVPEARSSW
jgi:N6-L-threonylcarbamoyladenine synthase